MRVTYHGGPAEVHWAVHVHNDRNHDDRVDEVCTVGDPAERVEEFAGE